MISYDKIPKTLVIIPDGLDTKIFYELLNDEKLPNIKHGIFDRSVVHVNNPISPFPSNTSQGMHSLMTGKFPSDPGLIYLANGNIVNLIGKHFTDRGYVNDPTIFDMLKEYSKKFLENENKDKIWTASIHNPWHDGVDWPHPGLANLKYLASTFAGFQFTNEMAANRYIDLINERDPDFTTVYFYATDRVAHIASKPKLEKTYITLDKQIGRIISAMEDKYKDEFDDTLIILLTDHSQMSIEGNLDFHETCRAIGFNPRKSINGKGDSYAFSTGMRCGELYPIKIKIDEELIKKIQNYLIKTGDNNQVIVTEKQSKRVFSKDYDARLITDDSDKIRIETLSGIPLGLDSDLCEKLKDPLSLDDLFRLTHNNSLPDSIARIGMSKHPNEPPIRFIAPLGHDYSMTKNVSNGFLGNRYNVNARRAHGGLGIDESRTILMIAGNKEKYGKTSLDYSRAIDWMSTYLDLCNIPHTNLHGRSLIKK